MGLLEKSLRLTATHKASAPGVVRALTQLEKRGEYELLDDITVTIPPGVRRQLERRGLF
jgi:hypothetical protein